VSTGAQRRQQDDEDEAERGPDRGGEHGVQRRVGVAEPAGGERVEADQLEHAVQPAPGRLVDPAPDDGDGHLRQDVRQEEDHPVDDAAPLDVPEQQRERQPEHERPIVPITIQMALF
jgi:hypothetical protein